MDVAQLILEYVQALVWPLVVIVLLVIFRQELRALAGRLTGAELPGVKLAFIEEQALKARVEAEDSKDSLTERVELEQQSEGSTNEDVPPASDDESGATMEVTEEPDDWPQNHEPTKNERYYLQEPMAIWFAVENAWVTFIKTISRDLHWNTENVTHMRLVRESISNVQVAYGLPEEWRTSAFRIYALLADSDNMAIRRQYTKDALINMWKTVDELTTQLNVAKLKKS